MNTVVAFREDDGTDEEETKLTVTVIVAFVLSFTKHIAYRQAASTNCKK